MPLLCNCMTAFAAACCLDGNGCDYMPLIFALLRPLSERFIGVVRSFVAKRRVELFCR